RDLAQLGVELDDGTGALGGPGPRGEEAAGGRGDGELTGREQLVRRGAIAAAHEAGHRNAVSTALRHVLRIESDPAATGDSEDEPDGPHADNGTGRATGAQV